jgi:hypothetical protein
MNDTRFNNADTVARRYLHTHGVQQARAEATRLLDTAKPNTWNAMIGQALLRYLPS